MLPDRSALISSSAWCDVKPLRSPVMIEVISLAPLDSGATFAFFGFFFIIDRFHLTHREGCDKNVLLFRLQLFNPCLQGKIRTPRPIAKSFFADFLKQRVALNFGL